MRVKFFLQLIIFSLIFPCTVFAQAEIKSETAKKWAQEKGQELLQVLSEPTSENKYERLDFLMTNYIDLDYLAKFVVGKYWKTMTPEEIQVYIPLFKRYSLALYKSFPLSFNKDDVDFKVTKTQVEKNYTNVFINVELKKGITGESSQKTNFLVEFRLRRNGSNIMIEDMKIGETSFLIAYRSRFVEMITKNDGDIGWFLEDLEDITKSIEIKNENELNMSY